MRTSHDHTMSTFDLQVHVCGVRLFGHQSHASTVSIDRAMDQDALLTQLLGMGFDTEEIERCQVAMATSSHSLIQSSGSN